MSLLLVACISLSTTACEYRDIDKILFITAILVDVGDKEGTYDVYFEAFRPSSSGGAVDQAGDRLIYGVTDVNVMEATDLLSNYANLTLKFSQTKMLLFTRRAAELGLEKHINLWHHANDFTVRTYIAIWDADPKKFEEVQLEGEKHLGIYLRTHIDNTEASTSHIKVVTMIDIMNASAIEGKILPIPMVKPIEKGKAQIIDFPGVALVRQYKMVGEIPSDKSNYLMYMLDHVRSDFIGIKNPSAEDAETVIVTMKSKTKTILSPSQDGMKVRKIVQAKAMLYGTQDKFIPSREAIADMEKQLNQELKEQCMDLYETYTSMGLDIFNLGESIYRRYPWFDQTDLFTKIDFSVEAHFEIQGSNYKLGFNLNPVNESHQSKKRR